MRGIPATPNGDSDWARDSADRRHAIDKRDHWQRVVRAGIPSLRKTTNCPASTPPVLRKSGREQGHRKRDGRLYLPDRG